MRGRSRSAGPGEIACGEEHSRSIVLEVPEHVPKRLTSARVHRAFIARPGAFVGARHRRHEGADLAFLYVGVRRSPVVEPS